MTLTAAITATPLGPMTTISAGDTLHVAAFGTDVDALREGLPAELRRDRVRSGDSTASCALVEYFDGDLGALDRVDVEQPGSALQRAVWTAMRRIEAGTTMSYAELAARAGMPRAARAAGSACARNAVCLFVPCHRVVRSDGSLGGYFYGLDVKARLLTHESSHRRATDPAQYARTA